MYLIMNKKKKNYVYANADFIASVNRQNSKADIAFEGSYPCHKTFSDSIRLIKSFINLFKYKAKNRSLYCLFILVLSGHLQAASASLTIRISTMWPLSHSNNLSFLHFKERLEAESKGDIHVDIYDSAKLYGDTTIAEAVSFGAVDMGYVSLSRYAATIPAADLFQLPFLF